MIILVMFSSVSPITAQESQDPTLLNGGSVLAMAGDGCVALAVDRRFGSGPQVVNVSPRLVLVPHPGLLVAFTGLEGDVQSLADDLSVQIAAKAGRSSGFGFGCPRSAGIWGWDGTAISPSCMSSLTSHVLYRRRRSPYYVEPIICGLEISTSEEVVSRNADSSERDTDVMSENSVMAEETESMSSGKLCSKEAMGQNSERKVEFRPFLCAQDVIGAQSRSGSFVCAGAASKSMFGTAEALWKPQLKPDDLVRICGRAFLSAMERDCLSGYGAVVYLLTRDGVFEYELACRND